MTVTDYYLTKGFSLLDKSVMLSGAGTHSVWIPKTGYRVVVTHLYVTSNAPAGTIAFYFDNGNDRIAQYWMAASSVISPVIGGWESTVASGRIFAVKSAIDTDSVNITLNGFEIPVTAI